METKKIENVLILVDLVGRNGGSGIVLSGPLPRGKEETHD
jgi:hypothetical protein